MRSKQVNRALRAARRTGFWKPNKWNRDEVFESAVIILVFTVVFTVIGLWVVEKLFPVG